MWWGFLQHGTLDDLDSALLFLSLLGKHSSHIFDRPPRLIFFRSPTEFIFILMGFVQRWLCGRPSTKFGPNGAISATLNALNLSHNMHLWETGKGCSRISLWASATFWANKGDDCFHCAPPFIYVPCAAPACFLCVCRGLTAESWESASKKRVHAGEKKLLAGFFFPSFTPSSCAARASSQETEEGRGAETSASRAPEENLFQVEP